MLNLPYQTIAWKKCGECERSFTNNDNLKCHKNSYRLASHHRAYNLNAFRIVFPVNWAIRKTCNDNICEKHTIMYFCFLEVIQLILLTIRHRRSRHIDYSPL